MMDRKRLLFFGTSEFAVPQLQALASRGKHDLVAVYTQPDKPAGRGLRSHPSPVALAAEQLGLPIEKPKKIRDSSVIASIRDYRPDLIILSAYGLIIPREALQIPPLGWINVHPSLLPKYRGAAPIQAAILAGESKTGVTLIRMGEGLDDGPILAQVEVDIKEHETAGELSERLAKIAADLLIQTLDKWIQGEITPVEQDHSAATYAPKISKEAACIDWNKPAVLIEREVRAFNPWPVSYTYWEDKRILIYKARAIPTSTEGKPGEVTKDVQTKMPIVTCGEGALLLEQLQMQGKKIVDGKAFLAGYQKIIGSILSSDCFGEPNKDS